MASKNKYRKLLSNTITFGIGTFSSKLLTFLLVPLYTRVLTTAEFNASDLIQQTGNLLAPLVTVGMGSALIRFGLDRSYDKASVFSTGLLTSGCGAVLLLLLSPLISLIPDISDHLILLVLFVIMSALRSLCSQFVRALGYVKLFSYDGVQSTVLTIVFNVLFLIVFKMGVTGYILATVVSDFISSVFLFFMADLHRYVRFSKLDRKVISSMVRYSVPMIPTSLFWWIINVSDRYAVTWMISKADAGIYAAAYKVPTIISLVSSVFTEAWQMSAVTEKDSANRDQFFSRVFSALSSLLLLTSSVLIVCSKLITKILVGPSFYDSWQYIPILVVATSFSCFSSFLNSVYMVEKKSILSLLTVMSGAVINIVLNVLLIPSMGVNGAAFATFISYFIVFLLRAVTSYKYVKINFHPARMAINLVLSGLQCYIMISELHLWQLWVTLLLAAMIVCNVKPLLSAVKMVLRRRPAAE